MEHFIIALKIVIALLIPDVPFKVTEDEFRREMIEEKVQKELLEIKYAGNHESFQDMTTRLQRTAAEIVEKDMRAREAEEAAAPKASDLPADKRVAKAAARQAAKERQETLLKQVANANARAMKDQ